MLTTIKKIQDACYDWITSVLPDRECIVKKAVDVNIPNKPYVMFGIQQADARANPIVELIDDGLTELITQEHLITISIQVVGDSSQIISGNTVFKSCATDIKTLAATLSSQKRYLDLWQHGGLGGKTIKPQNITTAAYGTNQQRWNMEFTIYADIQTVISDADYIDNVPTKVIDGADKSIIYNGTLGDNPHDRCD